MNAIRITVTRTAGSVPREAGTQMLVWSDRSEGTIGGGALEWQAMVTARKMLESGDKSHHETIALGPSLGQCCGGSVSLLWEDSDQVILPKAQPVWIYGAGHVGRALVGILAHLPDFDVVWIDTAVSRFPKDLPHGITQLVASDPAMTVRRAPADAHHLIMTYAHEMDLAICDALLRHQFASAGVIGSATKLARFRKRLAQLGHAPSQTARIACPIGDPSLGKHPQHIAIGVAASLLRPADTRQQRITG